MPDVKTDFKSPKEAYEADRLAKDKNQEGFTYDNAVKQERASRAYLVKGLEQDKNGEFAYYLSRDYAPDSRRQQEFEFYHKQALEADYPHAIYEELRYMLSGRRSYKRDGFIENKNHKNFSSLETLTQRLEDTNDKEVINQWHDHLSRKAPNIFEVFNHQKALDADDAHAIFNELRYMVSGRKMYEQDLLMRDKTHKNFNQLEDLTRRLEGTDDKEEILKWYDYLSMAAPKIFNALPKTDAKKDVAALAQIRLIIFDRKLDAQGIGLFSTKTPDGVKRIRKHFEDFSKSPDKDFYGLLRKVRDEIESAFKRDSKQGVYDNVNAVLDDIQMGVNKETVKSNEPGKMEMFSVKRQ